MNSQRLADLQPTDLDYSLVEWPKAQVFCSGMEQLHDALERHWACECPDRHSTAKFSFEWPCTREDGSLNCVFFCPDNDRVTGKSEWREVKLSFEMQNEPPDFSFSTGLDIDSGAPLYTLPRALVPDITSLCNHLSKGVESIKIVVRKAAPSSPASLEIRDATSDCRLARHSLQLDDWLRTQGARSFIGHKKEAPCAGPDVIIRISPSGRRSMVAI